MDRVGKLPERWKKPQFQIDRMPKNAGNGYFGYNNKDFTYASDPYKEVRTGHWPGQVSCGRARGSGRWRAALAA